VQVAVGPAGKIGARKLPSSEPKCGVGEGKLEFAAVLAEQKGKVFPAHHPEPPMKEFLDP